MNKTNWIKRALGLVAAGAAIVAVTGPSAEAGTSPMTAFNVQAIVGKACSETSAWSNLSVNYAGVKVTSPASTATINCQGLVAAGEVATMTFTTGSGAYKLNGIVSGGVLNYTLCQDGASCAVPYPYNTATNFNVLNGNNNLSVYLQVPGGQGGAADTYQDTVTGTVTF